MQEAKQKFSEVVRRAQVEGPQLVTNRGEKSAWIISDADYKKLQKKLKMKTSILDVFQDSPFKETDIPVERRNDLPRDIDL